MRGRRNAGQDDIALCVFLLLLSLAILTSHLHCRAGAKKCYYYSLAR